jgi:hypothetical protein
MVGFEGRGVTDLVGNRRRPSKKGAANSRREVGEGLTTGPHLSATGRKKKRAGDSWAGRKELAGLRGPACARARAR